MQQTLKSLLIASTLVLAAATPAVFAQSGPSRMAGHHEAHGMAGGHRLLDALEDVGVSAATREQVKAIFKAAREDLKGQHEQGKALRQQALQLWAAPNIDAAALDAVRKQQSVLHDRATSRMQQAMVDVGRLLSPEQRAKLVERMKKTMQRMQERRGS
jgi:Spy/CpxP family protein refolding chaperone